MDNLIRLRSVEFCYEPARPVLKGVDLVLRRGERVGLTGPTGSGKTTLLLLMVGLLQPTGGEVEVLGRVRRRERDFHEVRRRVGLVFQDPEDQLFCPTVAEDVAFGPLNLGKSADQAKEIARSTLQNLGLEDLADRVTYRLSFGQKRLVSFATVLAMEPEVILVDEPVAGLDPHYVERVSAILRKPSRTTLVVSHNLSFLRRISSRLMVLRDGRLEEVPLDEVSSSVHFFPSPAVD